MPHTGVQRLVLNRTAEPAVEPVSLSEAKDHLLEENVGQDTYITSLIVAAREFLEKDIRRALITQTWERKLDIFPRRPLWAYFSPALLPRPPLIDVQAIEYVDRNGDTQTLDSSVYVVDTDSVPGRITLAPDQFWPELQIIPNAITIRYTAGYGNAADDVPMPLRHAIKLLVSQLFENREPEVPGMTVAQINKSYDFLVSPYRVHWF